MNQKPDIKLLTTVSIPVESVLETVIKLEILRKSDRKVICRKRF